MFKQILGKLPGNKSSKSTQGIHHETSGARNPNSDASGRNPNSGSLLIQGRFSNGVKTTPFPVGGTGNEFVELLPSFRDVAASERQNLLIRKLNMCSVVFDFTDPTKNVKEKDMKRQTLQELTEFIGSYSGKFSDLVTEELTKMVQDLQIAQARIDSVGQSRDRRLQVDQRCMWCDMVGHTRRDCVDFTEALRSNVVYLRNGRVHASETREVVEWNIGRGGMKWLMEEAAV